MSDKSLSSQDQFFSSVARARTLRVSVRSICLRRGAILLQRPADDPKACFAFIGGALEHGELFEQRLRTEYQEELGVEIDVRSYLFVVENRFRQGDGLVHSLEHYFEVSCQEEHVTSREPHLSFTWVPLDQVAEIDLRPRVVARALVDGSWRERRHFVVPLE